MYVIEPVDHNVIGHQNHNNLINNIKVFNHIRNKGYKRVKLGITFVATKSNVHQLANFPMFIIKYSVEAVNVSNLYASDFEAQKELLYEKSLNMSIGSDSCRTHETKVTIPFMDFNLPGVQTGLIGILSKMNYNLELSNSKISRPSKHCRFIEEGMRFVRSDGNVSPCMELLHNGVTVLEETKRKVYHHSFGNIGLMGLSKIWESDEYTSFRNKVKKFDFSPCLVCGHCEYTEENMEDCIGNSEPTCGACLWAEGFLSCP
jgi:MoaA/NifB/PqqE/SkfB family radical SAM enzyme